MDKMPAGILDVLRPYLDNYEKVGEVDYRQTTFIFIRYT
jgi:hypothetical protein